MLAAPPRPAFLWLPPGATTTAGEECADLAAALGFQVDGPERDALNVLMAEAPDGQSWAGLEAAIICGRQNLKTWALLMTVIYDAWVRDVRRVVWTSHRFKTTQSAFEDLTGLISQHEWLARSVRKERHSSGDEGIELVSGARIDFLARTSGGGRGLTGDTVILDEALYLQPAMMGALLPTLSSRPDPHVRYGSSAGLMESAVLRSVRDRGRASNDPSLSYVEWSSERGDCLALDCGHEITSEGCQLDDEDRWTQANPAIGRRISVDYIRQERRALPPDEFARERLGWWEDPPVDGSGVVFPPEAWTACRDTASQIEATVPLAWAVDISFDRAYAHVVAFGAGPDGLPHGLLRHTCDPASVVAYLAAETAARPSLGVALQATGAPVSSLLPDLERELSCPVVPISGADVAKACGLAYDAVTSGTVRHRGQSQIDRAIGAAEVRSLSDGWALDRKRSRVDIAPLVAWVHGLWLHQTYAENSAPDLFVLT
jgi:hypothetical protein